MRNSTTTDRGTTRRRRRTTLAALAIGTLALLNRLGVYRAMPYALTGVALWAGIHAAGLHATLAGVLLVAAGLSQFLPLKRACLSHCRNPLTYFLARWKNGPTGGFRLGLTHGAYCLGCCWLVMLSGFGVGLMNLAWMALLTVVLCLEQVAPGGERIGQAAGLGMAAWGLALLLT